MRNKIIQNALRVLNPAERIFLTKYVNLLYGRNNSYNTNLLKKLNEIDDDNFYRIFLELIQDYEFTDSNVLEFYGSCLRRGDDNVTLLTQEMFSKLIYYPNLFDLPRPEGDKRINVFSKIVFGYGFYPGLYPKNEIADRFNIVTESFIRFENNHNVVEHLLKIGRFQLSRDNRFNHHLFSTEDRERIEADIERLNQFLAA